MAKILIVDDEDYVRELIAAYLEGKGHELRQARDGAVALELFKEDPADVVITDNAMPRMTGVEMIGELRKDRPDVKVLAMSGLSLTEEARNLVDAVVQKPFARQELLDALSKLLDE